LLQARREWRVAQLARRYGITPDEAARRITTTDEARVRYQQHYFNANMYDCALYDLVFNTEVLGLETTVDLATRAVRDLCAALSNTTA
jgi:cytidylate kinase